MYKLVEKSVIIIDEPPYQVIDGHILMYERNDIIKVIGSYKLLCDSYLGMYKEGIKFECEIIVYDVDRRYEVHFPIMVFKLDNK
jgi:hypothetical protein